MRICSGAGCLRAVRDDVRFCDECQPEHAHKETRHERAQHDAVMSQYGTPRWRKVRKLALQAYPFCAECQLTASRVVDHKIPARIVVAAWNAERLSLDRWGGFYIVANLVGLCHGCHNKKTYREHETHVYRTELSLLFRPYRKRSKGEHAADHMPASD